MSPQDTLVVKKGHSEEARYLCDKKQRCTAVKTWRSSTSITGPNGCRGGCQSMHIVHGTTFRTRYLTDGSRAYPRESFPSRFWGWIPTHGQTSLDECMLLDPKLTTNIKIAISKFCCLPPQVEVLCLPLSDA